MCIRDRYKTGTTNFTDAEIKNANQAWSDVVSGGGKPADNATVGAVIGTNMYKDNGSTLATNTELLNTNTVWADVSGTTNAPANNATVGATVGTNFYKSGTTTNYVVAEFQNNEIGLHADGYLTNIGTTEKLKNALIEMNTDGSLNYAGSGNGAVTMNTLTDANSIRSRLTAGLDSSGNVNRTVPSQHYTNTTYTFEDILTANSVIAQWTTSDGAVYSPTSLTQDLTVTYDNSTSKASCTVRWTMVNVSGNSDYISACAFQGTSTGFSLGSITDLSGNDVKYATCVVTHDSSSETITLSALISQLNVSGGGK